MYYSAKFAKNIVICAHFLLIILFFTVETKAQVVGGVDLTIQPDGKILVYGNNLTVNGAPQSIARLNQNGVPEASFSYFSSTFAINSAVVQADGKIIVAGSDNATGFRSALVRRLNSNGTVDTTFTEYFIAATPSPAQFNAIVWAVQADGKLLISIRTTAFGQETYDVRRLNVNGGLDSTFTTIQVSAGGQQTVSYITKVALQADEKILVANRPLLLNAGSSVRRYNQNGTSDSSFAAPTVSGTTLYNYINDVVAGADGGIIIGGSFQKVNSVDRNNLAKLQATGSLDTGFTSPLGNGATSGSNSGDEVRRIAILSNSNQQIIVSTSNRFVKLNSNGTIDNTFASSSAITEIIASRIDSAGRIVFIGTITGSGSPATKLWRLNADGSIDSSFSVNRTQFDFDGDGRADIAVFRPSNGVWYVMPSQTSSYYGITFGQNGDKIVPADWDGDGKTDIAVFREGALGYFYILDSTNNTFRSEKFGITGDKPLGGDWDGDGKADLAVFRTEDFYYRPSTQPNVGYIRIFTGSGNRPVVGDFDGDGKIDPAVFNVTGVWSIRRSSDNQYTTVTFGAQYDIPVAADYDGDGKADIAVYRPSNGVWYLQQSTAGFAGIAFGAAEDLPVPADYDGDGKADVSVFRPSNGAWYLNRSQAGFTGVAFGAAVDRPVPNAFVP